MNVYLREGRGEKPEPGMEKPLDSPAENRYSDIYGENWPLLIGLRGSNPGEKLARPECTESNHLSHCEGRLVI